MAAIPSLFLRALAVVLLVTSDPDPVVSTSHAALLVTLLALAVLPTVPRRPE